MLHDTHEICQCNIENAVEVGVLLVVEYTEDLEEQQGYDDHDWDDALHFPVGQFLVEYEIEDMNRHVEGRSNNHKVNDFCNDMFEFSPLVVSHAVHLHPVCQSISTSVL